MARKNGDDHRGGVHARTPSGAYPKGARDAGLEVYFTAEEAPVIGVGVVMIVVGEPWIAAFKA